MIKPKIAKGRKIINKTHNKNDRLNNTNPAKNWG